MNKHQSTKVTRRALVTGGAGFIGSHLCEALVARGWKVVSVDDESGSGRSGSKLRWPAGIKSLQMDVADPYLGQVMSEFNPSVVFHLAAVSSESLCEKDPGRCWEVNVEGTARVLEAARRSGASQLVNVSSLAVHGTDTRNGGPSYGSSKREAELLVNRRAPEAGIGWVNLRLANVYGPRQYGDGESAVVATWLKAMADGSAVILDGDGQQTRDFLYVTDAVEALILAANGACGQTLELGRGVETSLLRLLGTAQEVTGWEGVVGRRSARKGDIRRSVTDPDPARQALNWTARTDLTTGLQKTWDWLKSS